MNGDFDSHIQGIPCRIAIDNCYVQDADPSCTDSDADYYGYSEIDYTVLDRRGRPAPWLAKKATDKDNERIEREILTHTGATA